jgi:hypothetical protein
LWSQCGGKQVLQHMGFGKILHPIVQICHF